MGVNYGRSRPEHMGGSYRFEFPSPNEDLSARIVEAQEQRQKFLKAQEEEEEDTGGGSTTTPTTPTPTGGGGRSFPKMPMTPRQRQRQEQRAERGRILAAGTVKDPLWGDDVHPGSYAHWKAAGGSEEGWQQYMEDLRNGKVKPTLQHGPEPDPNAGWGEPEGQTPSQPSGPSKVPSLFGGEHAPAKTVMGRVNRAQRAVGIVANKAQKVKSEVDAQKTAKQQQAQEQADAEAKWAALPAWLK